MRLVKNSRISQSPMEGWEMAQNGGLRGNLRLPVLKAR